MDHVVDAHASLPLIAAVWQAHLAAGLAGQLKLPDALGVRAEIVLFALLTTRRLLPCGRLGIMSIPTRLIGDTVSSGLAGKPFLAHVGLQHRRKEAALVAGIGPVDALLVRRLPELTVGAQAMLGGFGFKGLP